jgi:D-ribose pyranase
MKKKGILNRDISNILSMIGHKDTICVCDAGFPIPQQVKCVDVSLSDNKPGLIEVLSILLEDFIVEKVVIAEETKKVSPTMYNKIIKLFPNVEIELIPHDEFKIRSNSCKGIIRTGEFTSFSNVILVSGVDSERWYQEVK